MAKERRLRKGEVLVQVGSRCVTAAGRSYFFTRDLDHSDHQACIPLYRIKKG